MLKELNGVLRERNEHLTITAAGGFTLQLHGIRATHDIDAFYQQDNILERDIFEIGNKYGANIGGDLWLNNSIETFNIKPPLDQTEEYLRLENLTIRTVKLEYLLYMKLYSAREKDINDASKIIQILKEENPIKVFKKCKEYSMEVDASLILWSFSEAYGEDWLVDYIESNKQEINKYFR